MSRSKFTPPPNLGARYTFTRGDVGRKNTRQPEGFGYSNIRNKPCDDKYKRLAKGCKVQLVFDRGQPLLRFCKVAGRPGPLVPVSSAEEAVRVGREGCACLQDKTLAQAQACFPTSVGLGRVRRRR